MATALGGFDALVFTAGVGEHSARVRADICRRLGHLGLRIDAQMNASLAEEGALESDTSTVTVRVVRAREDIIAARAVRALVG